MANNTLLASDDFSSGSLSALKWTAISTQVESQITGTPFVAEGPSLGVSGNQYYSGISWPNDQTSEITVANLVSGSVVDLWVRVQTGAFSGYVVDINGNNTVTLYKCVAGSFTSLTTGNALAFAVGDVWTLQAAGACLTVYQNNVPIIHWGDATFTSGSPGFRQQAATSLANSQISSWRGYSAVQQDGIWQKQGIILPALSGDIATGGGGTANASMLYEGNAQLLSGTVFKMWFSAGPNAAETNTYYAESSDGLNWTRKVAALILNQGSPFIFKNGATYYLYTQANGSQGLGNFSVYTSPDGIVWTLASGNFITLGTVGQWDAAIMWYFQPVAIIAGTWYAIYSGGSNTSTYQLSLGLATSSDGINWTRYVSNPVLSGPGNGSVVNSSALVQIGTTYYMWMYGNQPGGGGQSGPQGNLEPGEGVRYKTTDFIHWTFDAHSIHRSQMFEGTNFHGGQAYPNAIFNVNGKAYMFIQSAPSDNGAPLFYQLSVATGPASISSIITGGEDATLQVAADSFTSGTGNLSANWSTPANLSALQIVNGNLAEATATSTYCGARYTGASFSDSQYSEVTITTLGSNQTVNPAVRMQANGDCYIVQVAGATGSGNANFHIYKRISAVLTIVGQAAGASVTAQVGDVFRLTVINVNGIPTLTLYQNGFQLLQVEDWSAAIPSGGNSGFLIFTTVLVQAQVSRWAGGNANVIPTYASADGGLVHLGNFPTLNFNGSVQVGNVPANQ